MPQFDFFSFFVQIFWLSVGSTCLFHLIYLKVLFSIYLKIFLNSSSKNIKNRRFKEFRMVFINSYIVDYPTPLNLVRFLSLDVVVSIVVIAAISKPLLLLIVESLSDYGNVPWTIMLIKRFFSFPRLHMDLHENGISLFFLIFYYYILIWFYYRFYRFPRVKLWIGGLAIFWIVMIKSIVMPNVKIHYYFGNFFFENITINPCFNLPDLWPYIVGNLVVFHWIIFFTDWYKNSISVITIKNIIVFYFYSYSKDLYLFFVFIFFLSILWVYYPNSIVDPDEYIKIKYDNNFYRMPEVFPEWYFLSFYTILRCIPDQLGGIIALFLAIIIPMFLPFLSTSEVRISNIESLYVLSYWFFIADFIFLGLLGRTSMETPFIEAGIVGTLFYFFFLLIWVPGIGYLESRLASVRVYRYRYMPGCDIIEFD